MKPIRTITFVVVFASLLLAACGPAATPVPTPPPPPPTAAPTEAPVVTQAPTEAPRPRLSCATPIKIGLITDASGALAIYGAHILRSFMLGMEYATGNVGSAGAKFTLAKLNRTPSCTKTA